MSGMEENTALIEFLKGTYTQKLAETYGAKQHRKTYLKSTPFSHAPHNQEQKDSWVAFNCLQRFCGGLSKFFGKKIPLQCKNKNPLNVLETFFAPLIKNHEFNLTEIYRVILSPQILYTRILEGSAEENFIRVQIVQPFPCSYAHDKKNIFAVVGADGSILTITERIADGESVILEFENVKSQHLFLLVWQDYYVQKIHKWANCCVSDIL